MSVSMGRCGMFIIRYKGYVTCEGGGGQRPHYELIIDRESQWVRRLPKHPDEKGELLQCRGR